VLHQGSRRLFKRPQFRCAASNARLTAVAGSRILRSTVLSATIATLLGQRASLEYELGRRGATASHSAIVVNTPMNAPSLIVASLIGIVDLDSSNQLIS